jgi:hypothetical protein
MRVAITFGDHTEHERRDHEYGYSAFCWREAEFLPHLIEFETPAPFNQFANPSKWPYSKHH